jgi:hypothetical protein
MTSSSRRGLLCNLRQNKPIKRLLSLQKGPAQVAAASPAESNPPDMSGKPGEFRARLSGIATTGGSSKTAQLKNYPCGVKKRMRVGSMYRDLLVRGGHFSPA